MNFAAFARVHGVLIDHPVADGRIHRCPTENHPRKKNGAYKFTGEWGWVQSWEDHESPIIFRPDHVPMEVVRRDMAAERRAELQRRENASRLATSIVARCAFDEHPYLIRKGFPFAKALVDTDGRMVVPMRDATNYKRVNSVQFIDADGTKKFLPGGQARGSVLIRGSGTEQWLCEGFATGLAIEQALTSMYRQARVVICFSAGNLAHVSSLLAGRRYVIADNDESGTGARYAAQTGLPWVMPDTVGQDANDLMQACGVRALVGLIQRTIREAA